MRKILIVGHGGRESAFAANLANDCQLYAISGHLNPSMAHCCQRSGGQLLVGAVDDGAYVARYAREKQIDLALVNADGPLSQGVVDQLMDAGIKTVGPTRAGARLEWDKIFAMRMIERLFPHHCPRFAVVEHDHQAAAVIAELCEQVGQVVIKPQGLTGGKGVKVMGEHLADQAEAVDYTAQLLKTDNQVLVVEKLEGIEFTLMGITDGLTVIGSPLTYDYPYRLANDHGPGTGGMGCITHHGKPNFFLRPSDYDTCLEILSGVIDQLRAQDVHFSGVLNGGFFLTARGLYFMEFNARIGDPEGVNILSLMQSPLSALLTDIHEAQLNDRSWQLSQQASVVKYLVSPDYPNAGPALSFHHSVEQFESVEVHSHFASVVAEARADHFRTVSSSRLIGLSALADSVDQAAERVNRAIESFADRQLQYRADIGLPADEKKLWAHAARLYGSD